MAEEYISREEALNALLNGMVMTGYQTRAMDCVRFIPAADVVEVVRCKDCKHYKRYTPAYDFAFTPNGFKYKESHMCCSRYSELLARFETDYCSYAEKKEGKE